MINNTGIDFFPPRKWLKDVNGKTLAADLLAGVTGLVIVLPQGVAFAMIAGLPPIYGLYAAMVIPIVASLFGSSKHLISGPATAISIVIFSAVSQYAEPNTAQFVSIAIMLTLAAGLVQLALGLAGLGVLVNFVNHSVITGFTAGAAFLIITSQVKYLTGVDVPLGTSFFDTWAHVFQNLDELDLILIGIGISVIVLAVLLRKIHRLVPHLFLSMIAISFATFYFFSGYESITYVGSLPQGLPPFHVPDVNFPILKKLAPNIFAIALLGLLEAVAMGRSIAVKSGQRINPNQEFVGQGLSNIVGSFFSGFIGSGSFTRSGVNYSAGAKTPLAAVFTSLMLMVSISFVAPLAAHLPIAVVAGVIALAAFNLIDFPHIKKLVMTSQREFSVMIITFLATLLFDLEYAIYLGVFLSLALYLRQTSKPRFVEISPDPDGPRHMFLNIRKYDLNTCPQLMIFRVEGSLFFGAVEHVTDKMEELFKREERNLLLVSNNINIIDNTGAEFLVEMVEKWRESGKQVYFSGMKLRTREFMRSGGYVEEIGEENFFGNKEHAIEEIYKRLDRDICMNCPVRIFKECPEEGGSNSNGSG